MKSNCCESFKTILRRIKESGITTRNALMADEALYADFWHASEDMAKFVMANTLNSIKVETLVITQRKTTRYDIVMDAVSHIAYYLDNMLAKSSINHMYRYAYRAVNTVVNRNYCNLIPREGIVSLNAIIDGCDISLEEMYADYSANPEEILCAWETVKERMAEYKARKARKEVKKAAKAAKELAEMRERILCELPLLAKHPARMMAWLAAIYLKLEYTSVVELITEKGIESAYNDIITLASEKFGIDVETLLGITDGRMPTIKDVWANKDEKSMTMQQYRLVDRAKDKLGKQ